jgi:hypothetical protein
MRREPQWASEMSMPEQIFETVVTTCSPAGEVHVAPMGVRYAGRRVLLKPFKPSTTHDNIVSTGMAVLNVLTDVRVFAGCVTGRRDWPVLPVDAPAGVRAVRLACALGHAVLSLVERQDDSERPLLWLAAGEQVRHAPYLGFNRAQAAVIEGAVLVSRLHLLPTQKIDDEMRYLQIAIDKTAGPDELEAWQWLQQAVARHRADGAGTAP